MKAALSTALSTDLLAAATIVLPAAAWKVSNLLEQSMRRPSIAGLLLHSMRLAF